MIEDSGQVEIVEKMSVLGHIIRIVLGDKFELIKEFSSAQDLNFSLELTNHVFELVVDYQGSITLLGMLEDLISDGGS